MTDDRDFSWLGKAKPAEGGQAFRHVCNFWTLRGPSDRDLACAAYKVASGLELRSEYGPADLVASQLFRGADADERLAETANTWRRNLMMKGFKEIAR